MPLCFIKGFLFSFVSAGIFRQFGSAGWLFRYLLLFSDCITLPLLYLFWIRNLSYFKPVRGCEAIFIATFVFLVWSVDYRVISPVLACLIDF